jgi:hypothetical protein
MFFMALRYDGMEENTENLQLSDCPCACENTLGMLTDLLAWHQEDPVDVLEQERNEGICSFYQNNRNPFIDFPGLGPLFFGSVDSSDPCPSCECSSADDDDATSMPDDAPPFFSQGDIAIVGFNSDSPKGITLAVLVDTPANASFTLTDKGWVGADIGFREGSEGVLNVGRITFIYMRVYIYIYIHL